MEGLWSKPKYASPRDKKILLLKSIKGKLSVQLKFFRELFAHAKYCEVEEFGVA